jgi:PAS domain S-box-containing protein
MSIDKKNNLKLRIEEVLNNKAITLENAYTKSLEELVEELKIYQYELEFQNDELQRVQLELEQSRNEYKQLFEQAPVGYVIIGDDMRLIDCNQTFRNMLSGSKKRKECQQRMDFREFIAAAYQDKFYFFCAQLSKTKGKGDTVIKLNLPDDEHIYVDCMGRYASPGGENRFFLSLNDITEKKLAQEKLKESEERFRNLFENEHTVMLLIDPESGIITEANPAAQRFYGYSAEQLTGMHIAEINTLTPAQLKLEMEAARLAQKTIFYFRHRTASGNLRDVEVYSGTVQFGGKKLLYSIVHDITDRRIAEEELMKTKELLLQTSRTARVGGWEIDMDTQKAVWSEVTREIVEVKPGYSPDLDDSIKFYKEGHSRETIQRVVSELAESGKPFDEELQIITAKGSLKWVRSIGHAQFENGRCKRIYGTFQDIDLKKKQEEILRKSEKELKELNATKDKLFSIIAHDLKSPFNSILGLSELLKEDAQDCEPKNILKYSTMINSSATQAYNLLENLLAWARVQLGKLVISKESFNLKAEVDSVFYLFTSRANAKDIQLINKVSNSFTLSADINIIKTVLRNLISNAIKFTPNSGIIYVDAKEENGQSVVSVIDNGVGIPAKNLNLIFDPDEYYTTPGTQNERGTGLGLILCKYFIEEHGGMMMVESEEGTGSAFSFRIPSDD